MNNRTRLRINVDMHVYIKQHPERVDKSKAYQVDMAKQQYPHMSWRKRSKLGKQMERDWERYGDYLG